MCVWVGEGVIVAVANPDNAGSLAFALPCARRFTAVLEAGNVSILHRIRRIEQVSGVKINGRMQPTDTDCEKGNS